jgi:hypothetical protein
MPALKGGREELFAWTVALHNIVNVETNKPIMTVEEAMSKIVSPTETLQEEEKCTPASRSSRTTLVDNRITYSVAALCVTIVALVALLLYKKLYKK